MSAVYNFLIGGGLNYTGKIACNSGETCVFANDYWYQCQTALIPTCTTSFAPITASDAFAALTPGIRVLVTWFGHISVDSSPWTIDSTWLDRVEAVVDQVLDRGFYAIINVHHDSQLWANLATSGANHTLIEEKFKSIWTQVGVKLGCKSSKLLFESINEPAGSTESEAVELNALNDIFLDAINIAGGFNPQRTHLFFGDWGTTIWGSDDDKAALDLDFSLFHDNFTSIPTFIGEWDATPAADLLDCSTHTWYDETVIDILINAAADTVNSLPESTTDLSATSQSGSAYLFHAIGAPVTDQSVSYILNGNTLASIKNSAGTSLTTSQFTFSSGGVLTLSMAYLSPFYDASSTAGIKDTLTLQFSKGADLSLQIVQYGTPTIGATSYTAQATDMEIPISYAGLAKGATVRAVLADGTYLTNAWTTSSGPLQQGRWTQGNYGFDSSNFIIYDSGGQQIIAAGQPVSLMLEFYPRSVGENVVNITVHS
ncbi:hypothetical protein VE01_10044 [Pseudogymnoascus verrucosus]|uniref:CBM1 domain-containing protein n=1 Tax=Pseudogymnoascus verrucosus TaxID=342668 RepID=A0A1B8G8J6_9PEZI|nr:uncharacterized protein VE01_10044 [Pseudogymnoascus verrucosus]OBT92152.1 hypothetical protein VE01_10044 [Pseudogymnoascus verrucosus]